MSLKLCQICQLLEMVTYWNLSLFILMSTLLLFACIFRLEWCQFLLPKKKDGSSPDKITISLSSMSGNKIPPSQSPAKSLFVV